MTNPEISIKDSIIKKIFETEFIKETKLTSTILFSFIFVAIFAKVIFSGISSSDIYGSNGIASIDIMTYTIILISVVSIVFLNTIIASTQEDNNIMKTFSWDMVILVIYLCWIISINLKHYKRINMRKVPSEYFLYSNLTIWVIIGQTLFFMIYFILSTDPNTIKDIDPQFVTRLNFIQYILIFLNFLLILIQQIILDNFSVDII
tara:strand:+ start:281 stop:895 length:615 start_codon:yes stop_codon:yes gene_type:complete